MPQGAGKGAKDANNDAGAGRGDMSASAIAIMVLSLTLAILISLIVYALMTKHVPSWAGRSRRRIEEGTRG